MAERTTRSAGRWAVFESTSGGLQVRICGWTSRERAEDALAALLEDGGPALDVYIASEAGEEEATGRRSIEEDYRRHLRREHWPEDPHPDGGCWYCGSLTHPTDCCTDKQAKREAWG